MIDPSIGLRQLGDWATPGGQEGGEVTLPTYFYWRRAFMLVYHPPLIELEKVIKYVTSPPNSEPRTNPISEEGLILVCWGKTNIPYGEMIPPLPADFTLTDYVQLLVAARSNTPSAWMNIVLPTLKIVEASFISFGLPAFPRSSVTGGSRIAGATHDLCFGNYCCGLVPSARQIVFNS